jgi:hypothetical protein
MNNGKLDFDYSELKQYLFDNQPQYLVAEDGDRCEGYSRCIYDVEQFFIDKLKLKAVK